MPPRLARSAPSCSTTAITALLIALFITAPVTARESWSMAGSFNGWAAADPQWTLVQDATPRMQEWWALRKRIPAGSYRFKFVQDGNWDEGFLGATRKQGQLSPSGSEIALIVRAEAEFLITLNSAAQFWRMKVVSIDEPALFVDIQGEPQVERPFRVYTGHSLTNAQNETMFAVLGIPDQPTRRVPDPDDTKATLVYPSKAGELTLSVTLHDGSRTASRTIPLTVSTPSTVAWARADQPNDPGRAVLERQWDGSERAIIRVDREVLFHTVAVTTSVDGYLTSDPATVPAGAYLIEVRDGSAVKNTNPSLPSLLHPGNWHQFQLKPTAPVESVHVVGDFNAWASPDSPGAVELLSRYDGSYSAIVNLPEGIQRYAFVIDRATSIPDASNGRETLDPFGAAASFLIVGPSAADFPKARPNEINRDAVRHNPDSLSDFLPIDHELGIADISISALPQDVNLAMLNLRTPAGVQRIRMQRSQDAAGFDRFTARVMTGVPSIAYSFTLSDESATYASPEFQRESNPTWNSPTWSKGALWYQALPDRFRNGNTLNDPRSADLTLKEWSSDWRAIDPKEFAARNAADGAAPSATEALRARRYGGDLQGIVEKLDELKDLGVTVISLSQIFESASSARFETSDFRHIDDNYAAPASAGETPAEWSPIDAESASPETWTWTAADRYFIDVVLPECRKRDIRVVLEVALNRVDRSFWAFQHVETHGAASPYAEWFDLSLDHVGALASWRSWKNDPSTPAFSQSPQGDLAPPVKNHLFEVTRRWMDPNGDGDLSDGIDGWRALDVESIGEPFWREWRSVVKATNPDALIVAAGEEHAIRYTKGDVFDTQSRTDFARAIVGWLGLRPEMSEFDARLALEGAIAGAPQTLLAQQTALASLDTDRLVSMLLNPGRNYDRDNRPDLEGSTYIHKRPSQTHYKRALLGVAIQATYLGSPTMCYADEVGMWGADEPHNRKPYPWIDQAPKNPDDRANTQVLAEYQQWFGLRRHPVIGPILRYGAMRLVPTNEPDIFAFERSLNNHRVVVVANRSAAAWNASKLFKDLARDSSVPPASARYWLIDD